MSPMIFLVVYFIYLNETQYYSGNPTFPMFLMKYKVSLSGRAATLGQEFFHFLYPSFSLFPHPCIKPGARKNHRVISTANMNAAATSANLRGEKSTKS